MPQPESPTQHQRKLTLAKTYLNGKRALCRVDWNVPLDDDGGIVSDARIRATLPTLQYILDHGASVVAMSHLGRPDGAKDPKASLKPCADRLRELLPGRHVLFCDECRGPKALHMAVMLKPGEVLVVENVRFEPGETKNDSAFGFELSALGDIFVNDAFAASHRAHASVVGPPQTLCAVAGLLVEKEIAAIFPLLGITRQSPAPPRPFAALLGGAKVRDKVGVLEALIPKLDTLAIGGAMAYTFLRAQGSAIGGSRFESDKVELAAHFIELAKSSGTQLLLPTDHVCAASLDDPNPISVHREVPDGLMAFDIGPDTATRFHQALGRAHTIVWNGPLGVFEKDRFAGGTRMLVQTLGQLARSGKTVVAGGGETVTAAERFGVADVLTHISTGGGAFLELLEGKELPGLAALRSEEA